MGTPALDTLIVVEIFVSDPSIMASTVLVLAVDNGGRPCFDWDGGAGRDGVVNASQGRLQYGLRIHFIHSVCSPCMPQ